MELINTDAPNVSIMHLIKPEMKVCEIGVAEGKSSENFLNMGCFLYMVDPWENYEGCKEEYKQEEGYQKTLEVVKNYNTYKIIRKKSDEIIDEVPNDLDLVYVDGNHAYEYVKKDIMIYWPKVRKGGWLIGDDLSMTEVAAAVVHSLGELRMTYPEQEFNLSYFGRNWGIQKL